MQKITSHKAQALKGEVVVPGDKSISHRSLILGAVAQGQTTVKGLLEGEDVMATKDALIELGADISKQGDTYIINGKGTAGLTPAKHVLNMENTGTGARLMMGLVAGYDYNTFFDGDASLRKRPMGRIKDPLMQMGVEMVASSGNTMPLAIRGSSLSVPVEYELPVASAQVKSCILLAALNIKGITTVIEPTPTRNHSELMLNSFGAEVTTTKHGKGNKITIKGQPVLKGMDIIVPSDPSSAAFLVVASLITEGSSVLIKNICMNPSRTGLFDVLKRMGGKIEFLNERTECGDKVADIKASYSQLTGIEVEPEIAPSMIDEYPILAVAASYASGTTIMQGLEELKVKESDRLTAVYDGLKANGVNATMAEDSLTVANGNIASVSGGGIVKTHLDHRIAMSFLVMGLAAEKPVSVDDGSMIATSFPTFIDILQNLGANFAVSATSLANNYNKPYTIAIDGPAASGKGTIGRRIADKYGFSYLDTGRIYRAVAAKVVYSGLDAKSKQDAIAAAKQITLADLADSRIRQEKVGKVASVISAYPEVRQILLDFQRDFVKKAEKGVVLDGRDIGTVVCPEADLKIFITASVEKRADRRFKQLSNEGVEVLFDSVLEDLKERDERDSNRKKAPLKPAIDAITLDTTEMTVDQVFEVVNKEIVI